LLRPSYNLCRQQGIEAAFGIICDNDHVAHAASTIDAFPPAQDVVSLNLDIAESSNVDTEDNQAPA
jgi:hypothetical protein